MEDSGRYKDMEESDSNPILFTPEETPRATLSVTEEVYKELVDSGALSRYGCDLEPKNIIIKGESKVRTVHVQYFL